ncbi:hypothetical protein Misp01_71040 [Microtetraspora sp. NBRC 13810]|uniref:HAAS signaling domain-containing protein n=1 Tax=Microtetraspora sp. NBRC 13810 TaxID=3030990 RepID=UPI0024A5C64A|nr:hypothetical protein [Microtetraspora sp. NBRC 13810]GLW11976.1 hypothetical protein Misp01_71040 [Microtetraspora sp. NBRC 13810]
MTVLDRKYRDDLRVALRLRDISGARVGEVLAEVEAHVAETGEDPVAAFGSPKEYAAKVSAQLDVKTGKPSRLQKLTGTLITGLLTYVGLTLLLDGLSADRPGVPVTPAYLISTVVFLALSVPAVMLSFRAAVALSGGRVCGVLAACALAGAMAVAIFPNSLFDGETVLFEVSRWVAVGLGAAAVAGSLGLVRHGYRHGRIVDPR